MMSNRGKITASYEHTPAGLTMKTIFLILITLETATGACFSPLGMSSRAIKDDQITASSAYSSWTRPAFGRLRSQRKQSSSFGGWCAGEEDTDPFLQVDLVRDAAITGVATQGLAFPPDNWVTQYAVNYSCDGKVWRSYEVRGKRAILTGNSDSDTAIKSDFQIPLIARLLRIIPLDWNPFGFVCMRVESYGCYLKNGRGYEDCNAPVGVEDGRIQDHQITASSFVGNQVASRGRLHSGFSRVNGTPVWGGWCTDKLDKSQYLQVDLGRLRNVSGVATQGFPFGSWVIAFLVKYSVDGITWKTVGDENRTTRVFPGNKNKDTVVGNRLYHNRHVTARYVRFNPVDWKKGGDICMRIEIYVCAVQKACKRKAKPTVPLTTDGTKKTEPKTQSAQTTEGKEKTKSATERSTTQETTTNSKGFVAQMKSNAGSLKFQTFLVLVSFSGLARILSSQN